MTLTPSLKEILNRASEAFSPIADGFPELEISEPATEQMVSECEQQLGRELPAELRELFTGVAASIRFMWDLDDAKLDVPVELSGVDTGFCDISLDALAANSANWDSWESGFVDPQGHCRNSPLVDFHSLLPIAHTTNGDVIVLVAGGPKRGEVYYLDHEGGSMDWARLSPSLHEYLNTWFRLGCPGPESWCLEPFYDEGNRQLSIALPESKAWIRLLGLDGQPPSVDQPDLGPAQRSQTPDRGQHLFPIHGRTTSGYINAAGETVLEFRNSMLSSFHEGLASIEVRDHYGYINRSGEFVVEPTYDWAADISDGRGQVRDFQGKRGFIDTLGQVVIPIELDSVGDFCFGLAWVDVAGKKGFLDLDGNLAIAAEYDGATNFMDGLAKIYVAGLQGYINVDGEVVIPPQFKYASGFFEGFASVEMDGRRGFIDKTGRVVIEPRYDDASVFSEGLAGVNCGGRRVERFEGYFGIEGGKWGFLDKNGEL